MSKKIGIGVATALLVTGGTIWALRAPAPDPEVQRLQQMQVAIRAENLAPEQRRQRFEAFRKEMDQLRPEQREQVWSQMQIGFRNQMNQQIDAYFALPPAQQTAYLDQQIHAMEQRRKEWESGRPPNGQAKGKADGQGKGKDGQAKGKNWQNMSSAERNVRRKQKLDQTKPEERAKFAAYFDALRKRRAERGLPPMSMGPPPGR